MTAGLPPPGGGVQCIGAADVPPGKTPPGAAPSDRMAPASPVTALAAWSALLPVMTVALPKRSTSGAATLAASALFM